MKLIVKAAAIGVAVLALGACNKGHSDAGQNVIANTESAIDNIQAATDNKTDAMRNSAEKKADKLDNMAKASNASATGNMTTEKTTTNTTETKKK